MDKQLHIVTHDVPWPVDYGGVVDLFYKIKALHHLGIKIHLHCFTSNKNEQPHLLQYCESVHYYPRKLSFSLSNLLLPYIVQSRINNDLISNLNKDKHPVLLEGIHCSYPLYKDLLKDKIVWVRLHNVECNYYRKLFENESSFFKKIYYYTESVLLKKYENKLAKKASYLTVSLSDSDTYHKLFSPKSTFFLPVFSSWSKIKSTAGLGNYCLYHGNLSVNENIRAVEWLLNEVFSKCDFPFVIAGKNPSENLKNLAHRYNHTCIVENPSEFELDDLIRKAHINILPSFNNTGVKLKIVHALFNGKHCISNVIGVKGSGFEALCHTAEKAEEYINCIRKLLDLPFTEEDIKSREDLLTLLYNNDENAIKLINCIY